MTLLRFSILATLLVAALSMGLVQGMDAASDRDRGTYRLASPAAISAEAAEEGARVRAARLMPAETMGVAVDSAGQPLGDQVPDQPAAALLAIPEDPGAGAGTCPLAVPDAADGAWSRSATDASPSASQAVPMAPDVPAPGTATTLPPATTAAPATSAAPDGRRTSAGPSAGPIAAPGFSLNAPPPAREGPK